MSFQEELYYKIEAYLNGELDAADTAAFESQISSDDLLKAELEKHKVANALIVEQRLLSVKNIFQAEKLKDSNSNYPFKPLGFILVAVAAVGIGASVWMLNKNDVIASSDKDVTTAPQIVSSSGKSENKISEDNKISTLQEASKYKTSSENIGFHKQQIQQLEEHLHVDEKGVLHIDSSFAVKSVDEKTNTNVSNTPTASANAATSVNPCANVSIQSTVTTTATCSREATGTILVQNIKGGTKPYSITLSSINNDAVTNGQLEKGMYQAFVIDANGCVQNYSNISVTEKDCSKDYSFNPFLGEKWSIGTYSSAGQLEIYNKGGVLYYQTNLESHKEIEWSGIGTGNQIVPGYYIFVMKYADGTVQKGSVTIVH